jgi:Domain of unknown function (DUF1083).
MRNPLLASLLLLVTLPLAAEIKIAAIRERPANLFNVEEPVSLSVEIRGLPQANAEVKGEVKDYHGKIVWSGSLATRASDRARQAVATLSIPPLPPGYYELATNVTSGGQTGAGRSSFAVFPLVDRSAQEVRDGGYRIGLKKWSHGPMSWHGGIDWDEDEAMKATTRLGLQWTRDEFNRKSHQPVLDTINNYPMNVILKIERFPRSVFDEDRYGPLDAWIKARKPAWQLYTVPKKEPYQKWLREELLKIPPEQNVFEIWNEAYNGMSPEDFARICQYVIEVLREVRPDAIVGPNLAGMPGDYAFDGKFIAAGGMEGMNMVALHPYRHPPEGVREQIRAYREWLFKKLGREVVFTVTEYGSPTHPKGGFTENQQAAFTARQTILMYAEDIKIMAPHWMGQTERDPTYREDYYGFFRANNEPKPSVVALATTARMIDGGRYVGDLWFGPHVGASMFEKKGVNVLALWSNRESDEVELAPDSTSLRLFDVVGKELPLPARQNGRLKLTLTGDPLYLVGVGASLAAQTTTELNPDHWPRPPVVRHERTAVRFATPPVVDGKLDEWGDANRFDLINNAVAGGDGSANIYTGWDENFFYIAADVRDNEVINKNRGDTNTLYRGDSLEIFISGTPKEGGLKQLEPDDYQLMASPTSADGQPKLVMVVDQFGGKVAPVEGAKFATTITSRGWTAEIGIPLSALQNFPRAAGGRGAFDIKMNDADSTRSGRFEIFPNDNPHRVTINAPFNWALLTLGE